MGCSWARCPSQICAVTGEIVSALGPATKSGFGHARGDLIPQILFGFYLFGFVLWIGIIVVNNQRHVAAINRSIHSVSLLPFTANLN